MKERLLLAEQLDDFDLQGEVLHQTLKSLAWINKWLGNHQSISKAVRKVFKGKNKDREFHIVDLGCGGGDVLRMLAKKLSKRGYACKFTGIDGNPHTLAYAKALSNQFPQIDYLQADILSPEFSIPSCDLLISSHFLYHFEAQSMVRFLKQNLRKVGIAFFNSGLERNKIALLLFQTFSWMMPVNQLARTDGRLAIKRAFTFSELQEVLSQIPDIHFQLNRVPMFRLETSIFPSSNS